MIGYNSLIRDGNPAERQSETWRKQILCGFCSVVEVSLAKRFQAHVSPRPHYNFHKGFLYQKGDTVRDPNEVKPGMKVKVVPVKLAGDRISYEFIKA